MQFSVGWVQELGMGFIGIWLNLDPLIDFRTFLFCLSLLRFAFLYSFNSDSLYIHFLNGPDLEKSPSNAQSKLS